jgi:hypothetical protein
MFEYTIDLLRPTSFGKLPSPQEVLEVGSRTSKAILRHLVDIMVLSTAKDVALVQKVNHHLLFITKCFDQLNGVIPMGRLTPPVIFLSCMAVQITHPYCQHKLTQEFSISHLRDVSHNILIEVLSELLRNSLTWIQEESNPSSKLMVGEYIKSMKAVIIDLHSIFSRVIQTPRPKLALARMKLSIVYPATDSGD